MAEKINRSTKMVRVPIPIADQIKELSRLFREEKLSPESLQGLIERIDLETPDQDNRPSSHAPDPGLAAVLEKLAQMETAILDRLSHQPQHSSAPVEICTTNQLMERSGIPFGQLAAQARTTGQPMETVLAQRTGFKYLGNGVFMGQG